MLRKILGLVIGLMVGATLVALGEWLSHRVWPIDTAPGDLDAIAEVMRAMPPAAFAVLLVVHAVAGFGAGLSAVMLARVAWPAVVLSALFTLSMIANLALLPHPAWFWAPALLAYPITTWLGARSALAGRRSDAGGAALPRSGDAGAPGGASPREAGKGPGAAPGRE